MNAQAHSLSRRRPAAGFTLVELLVSTAVLSVLLLVTMTALETMQRSWRDTKGKVNQFRDARIAFETITRNLSQATLNTYWDYYFKSTSSNIAPSGTAEAPLGYVRQSELDFRVAPATELGPTDAKGDEYPGHGLFFQAPLGLSQSYRGLGSLLNARGYYIQYRSNEDQRPSFLNGGTVPVKFRYQLMEYRPPAEQVTLTEGGVKGNSVYTEPHWYRQNIKEVSRPIANNILFFLISPQVPEETLINGGKKGNNKWWIAPAYRFSSRDADNSSAEINGPKIIDGVLDQGTQHLLPPLVRVTLIAGEEGSMSRWLAQRGNSAVDIADEAGALFQNAQNYDTDLGLLKQYLSDQKLNYRVFTATIPLRNAAWDSSSY
jgi:uncharacterized protein (TIGR02599 family)